MYWNNGKIREKAFGNVNTVEHRYVLQDTAQGKCYSRENATSEKTEKKTIKYKSV